MSERSDWINAVQRCEDATAVASAARHQLVELRLALRGAARRGGHLGAENIGEALAALSVIEKALAAYHDSLRSTRGLLRESGDERHD